jgi:hypothetical protein
MFWFAAQPDSNMRGGETKTSVRLACPIICGV